MRFWTRSRTKHWARYALLALLLLPVADASAGVPTTGVLDFAILRNGDAIGRHVIRFARDGDRLDVRVEARVDYRLAFIPLYLFRHVAREVWRDGRLVRMTAKTDDNGEEYAVDLRPDGDGMALSVNGTESTAPTDIVPASLWNIAMVDRRRILDPADGEIMNVAVADAGEETVTVRGQPVRAHRFIVTGDFERELWYDPRGVLVQVRFTGDDGSEIRYELRSPRG